MKIELNEPHPDWLEDATGDFWRLDRGTGQYCRQSNGNHPFVAHYATVERLFGIVDEGDWDE